MATTETNSPGRSARAVVAGLFALFAVGAVASLMFDHGAGVVAASTNTAEVEPVSTETTPVTTIAPTTPATAPPDSQPSTTPSSGTAESDVDDGDIAPITWIAVIAAGVLLAIAVWWMLRRSDDDGPPADPHDSDWPARTDVI